MSMVEVEASSFAAAEEVTRAERKAAVEKRRINRGALPAHLPRFDRVVDVESRTCPCCSGTLHRIGEDVSERLDVVAAQIRVLVIRRPRYACRSCEDVVVHPRQPEEQTRRGDPPRPLTLDPARSASMMVASRSTPT